MQILPNLKTCMAKFAENRMQFLPSSIAHFFLNRMQNLREPDAKNASLI